jgi:serine/threonine protein kinase
MGSESECSDSEYLSVSSDEDKTQSNNLDLTGKIIKNYNVICELGRGSFSIVWLAFSIKSNDFCALKVQNPSEFKDGQSEIKFVQKLPLSPSVFNNICDSFIEIRDNQKYLCSSWNLHCSDIDSLIRKGDYDNGFDFETVKKIMKQLIEAVKILHKNFKVFHGDIKTDNVLVKGINNKDDFIIKRYNEENFFKKYSEAKEKFWVDVKKKDIDKIEKMDKNDKRKIRIEIHDQITNKILEEYSLSDISKYTIDSKYLESMDVSLADFGTYCEEHNFYEESFGTRYYQAPEIILMGKCSYPVDIWALGCTFYELLTGNLLFDPIKDSKHSRDYYHLQLIQETCGNFPKNFLKKTKYYKKFFNSNFKLKDYELTDSNRLDRKLNEFNFDKLPFFDWIKRILTGTLVVDPAQRWNIDELERNFLCSYHPDGK